MKNLKLKNLKSIGQQRGFTLIELLVVIAIISILATLLLLQLGAARTRARDAKRLSDINQISQALELYASDNNGTYPQVDADSRPAYGGNSWATFSSYLAPAYMSQVPIAPLNGQGEGAMCNNCDEYRYISNLSATGYSLCTYKATAQNTNGSNQYGPFYCVWQGCGAGASFGGCP